MNIKIYVVTLMLVILSIANVNAELPYESHHEHSFVVTGGIKWDEPFQDKSQSVFSLNYIYQNKISIGISYRDYSISNQLQYDAITLISIEQSGGTLPDDNKRYSYYNHYVQVKPFNLLNIEAPVSFSLLIAVQDVSDNRNWIVDGFIYKKFRLNSKSYVQPMISIGCRNISRISTMGTVKFGGALLYSHQLTNKLNLLITPQVNRDWGQNDYTVQLGISYGLGK